MDNLIDNLIQLTIRGENARHQTIKQLKESMLSALKWRGENGLEEMVDNLNYLMRYAFDVLNEVLSIRRSMENEEFKAVIATLDYCFDKEVRSLMIQKLVLYNDVTGDQLNLEKALVSMNSMISYKDPDYHKFRTTSTKLRQTQNIFMPFAQSDVDHLITLWSSSRNERILIHFSRLIGWMSQFSKYPEPLLSSKVFLKSCLDMRRYLILQKQNPRDGFGVRVLKSLIREVPDFLATMIKSASFLVNCWRCLTRMDMTVETAWIENCLQKLMEEIDRRITSFLPKKDGLGSMQVARYFRCMTFAIMTTSKTVNCFLRKSLWYNLFHLCNPKYTFRRDLTPWDSLVLLSKSEVKRRMNIYSTHSSSIRILHLMTNDEMKLEPLSRDDANMLEVPKHVNDALKAFPDDDLLLDPDVGYYFPSYEPTGAQSPVPVFLLKHQQDRYSNT